MFGASAVHGIVNVLTPRVADLPDVGRWDRRRLGFLQAPAAERLARFRRVTPLGLGAYGVGTGAPGWRDSSGRRRSQAQPARRCAMSAAASCGCVPRARCSTRKPPASSRATTATRTRTSPRPIRIPRRFAMPRARGSSAHYQRDDCFGRDCQLRARRHLPPLAHGLHPALPHRQAVRAQRADQLPGEQRGDEVLVRRGSTCACRGRRRDRDSELTEFQPGPSTDGTPAAECHPSRRLSLRLHRRLRTLGATLALDWPSTTLIADRRAARRPDELRLRQPDDRRQHRRERHALPRRLPVLAPRRTAPTISTTWHRASRCRGSRGDRSLLYLAARAASARPR